MQSITSNKKEAEGLLKLTPHRDIEDESRPPFEARRISETENGLDVLLDLVGHVRLPRSKQEELNALRALRCLFTDSPLTEELLAKKNEICRHMELVKEEEARALLEWINPETSGLTRIIRKLFRSRERHLLLFVLLAKIIAPITKFDIVPILYNQGCLGNGRDRFSLLSWLPRTCLRQKTLQLAMEYIDVSQMALFSDEDKRPTDMEATGQLRRYGWHRQLIQLLIWRSIWDLERDRRSLKPINPILYADTIEFALAHEGFFNKLSGGGRIPGAAMKRMAYRDRPRSLNRTRVRDVLSLALLVGLCLVACVLFLERTKRWDIYNAELAASVQHVYSNGVSSKASSAAGAGEAAESDVPGGAAAAGSAAGPGHAAGPDEPAETTESAAPEPQEN